MRLRVNFVNVTCHKWLAATLENIIGHICMADSELRAFKLPQMAYSYSLVRATDVQIMDLE